DGEVAVGGGLTQGPSAVATQIAAGRVEVSDDVHVPAAGGGGQDSVRELQAVLMEVTDDGEVTVGGGLTQGPSAVGVEISTIRVQIPDDVRVPAGRRR